MPTPLRVVCSWCDLLMRPGADPASDQLSHSCCCSCKIKYFPTLGDASECQMELEDREHIDCGVMGAPSYQSCHIDYKVCSRCERQETLEPMPCDCEPRD